MLKYSITSLAIKLNGQTITGQALKSPQNKKCAAAIDVIV
jgi:hypothetical protein